SDLTLWLKLDVAQGLERMAARGQADRIEQAGVEFHRRVHHGFAAQAQRYGERFITVDGSLSQLAVAEQVQAVVSRYLQQWYAL
ncbi:MAG: dTMP kinase, partial [Cyanobacteria bacterium P01_D01_bin.14]